ncbi:aldehyde dehydrogenase family protein [Nocardia sp. NPDC059228]|uniref:aldehyde dehydrogenase family protein n=1 Tax=Nocardia sp. NPDC059228 TaxID=3346777 RepID=UPI0036A0E7C5
MTAPIEVRSPLDDRLLATVPDSSMDEVATAGNRLRAAQPDWEAAGPKQRAVVLRRFRDWLLDNAGHLDATLREETGRSRREAALELPLVVEMVNYLADNAARFLAGERPRSSGMLSWKQKRYIAFRPYPVVGVISPWNFPLLIPGADVVPALLAGAAVLLKPSEVTPLTALELARGWQEIGAPPVFEVVTGAGATGAAVVDTVDYVQFTGSTRTGKAIAHRAVDRGIGYSLELGGKDPAIVLADADLGRAVAGVAWGGLLNSGQACVSVERVYVESPVYDEFVTRLTQFVRDRRQGVADDAEIGTMATTAQSKIVETHVRQALDAGATALTGGTVVDGGRFFEPTVLIDVDHSMDIMREETFGPTIPIMRVANAEEAVRLANDSGYGLSATVWTRDLARGRAIATRLDAGAVNINDVIVNLLNWTVPQGGWKSSGTGARFSGSYSLRKYTRTQAITEPNLVTLPTEPLWFPYTPARDAVAARALRFVSARGLRRVRR